MLNEYLFVTFNPDREPKFPIIYRVTKDSFIPELPASKHISECLSSIHKQLRIDRLEFDLWPSVGRHGLDGVNFRVTPQDGHVILSEFVYRKSPDKIWTVSVPIRSIDSTLVNGGPILRFNNPYGTGDYHYVTFQYELSDLSSRDK